MKKILSSLLALVMLLAMVPMGAVAVSAATSGTTGDCTWTLDDNGHLTISGNGKMKDYSYHFSTMVHLAPRRRGAGILLPSLSKMVSPPSGKVRFTIATL